MDAYSLCPGGTGKKIKHCACRDIAGELEKIVRAIEGNQRVAALDRINRALATKAHRPCLLALKSLTLLGMNEMQGLEDTVTTFVKVAADNPLAQGLAALLEVRKNRVSEAVDRLQTALSLVTDTFPGELYDIIAAVAEGLVKEQQYLAARGHLLFRAMLGGKNEDAARPLMQVNGASGVAPLLKRDLLYEGCPENATWKSRFNAAMRNSLRGAWKKSLEEYEKLDREFPGHAAILKNIAIARSYLGHPGTVDAWRAYARCEAVPFDSAVEAEATAQLLDYNKNQKTIGFVQLTINVTDAKALSEQLLSSKYVVSHKAEETRWRSEDSPRPKFVFTLIDRPMPASGEELTLEDVPRILCQALLFGRETDREPRLELNLPKNDAYQQSRAKLAEIGGELITSDETEEIVETVPLYRFELFPSMEFPQDTPMTLRRKLSAEASLSAFEEHWSKIPMAELDDKSPEQVADDPAYRVRLAAVLLVLEEMGEIEGWLVDVDVLRQKLCVAVPELIDPEKTDLRQLTPSQWVRVAPEKLTDEDLMAMYRRCSVYDLRNAVLRIGKELLRRDSLREEISRETLCGVLARMCGDAGESLEYLAMARQYAKENGHSPAQWLLHELPIRVMLGEVHEVQRLIGEIERRHFQEPGVAESLYNLLIRLGLISPEQLQGAVDVPAEEDMPEEEPLSAGQRIWMPGGAEAPPEEKRESKLWVPD